MNKSDKDLIYIGILKNKFQDKKIDDIHIILDTLKEDFNNKIIQEKTELLIPQKGDKGDKGDKGESGKDGENGKDGRDGESGKDGENGQSIHWLGEFEKHPKNKNILDVYRNISQGIVYIYNGEKWEVLCKDGKSVMSYGGGSNSSSSSNVVITSGGGSSNNYFPSGW